MNDVYTRQEALGLSKPSVSLIGTGGVGCWVALALVLGGVERIDLYDGDKLSVHNLNRFPLPPFAVGEMKSLALTKWLSTLRPEAYITARGEFIPLVHKLDTTWIVCATDSLASRRACYEEATRIGANYLEVGAEGERWSLSPTPPEFSTELEARPGYQSVPVHVGPCMMAGAAVSYYVLHNQVPTGSHTMNWEKVGADGGLLTGKWMSEVETWDDSIGEVSIGEIGEVEEIEVDPNPEDLVGDPMVDEIEVIEEVEEVEEARDGEAI